MKFFQTLITVIACFVGLAHGISYVIRIGGPRNPPIFPGQVWELPGISHILIVRAEDAYIYYEDLDDRGQVWCCRTRTFREHAKLVVGGVKPSPVLHLVKFDDKSNVIQLKKDKKDDSV